ncbi:MAG: homoserine kinase, partial [Rhodothermales bacterium]
SVLDAEDLASGGRHGDNALPALLGGLVLVSSSQPSRYRRIELPRTLHLALLLPEVEVLTKEARDMLPERVSLRDAVHNASELAFLVDAYRCGDWETVGRCTMEDRLVEPVRAGLVPCYDNVRSAALDAGAFGCALTGSGPAMFAVAGSREDAVSIRDAMVKASRAKGVPSRGIVTYANDDGVAEMAERSAEAVEA